MQSLLVIGPAEETPAICQLLESSVLSCNAHAMGTVEAGLAALREKRWNAIILALPRDATDLPEHFRTVVSASDNAPLVVVAGSIPPDTTAQALRNGATDVVSYARITRLMEVLERETTARSLIASRLHNSHTSYSLISSIVNNLPVGLIYLNARGEVVLCNEKALELLGLTEHELLGTTPLEKHWNLTDADKNPLRRRDYPALRAMDTGQPVRNTIMGAHRKTFNDFVWLLVDAIPTPDARGQVDHVIVSLSDVTEQRRMQKALQTSEERFRATLEGTTDAIYWLESCRDESGKVADFEFVELNKAAEYQLSMSRDQLIGRKICDVFPINRTGGFFTQYKQVVETLKPFQQEYTIPPGNPAPGHYFHVVLPVGDGVAIFNRDITEQRSTESKLIESEARFRSAFEHSGTAMFIVSLEGLRVLQANATACRYFGRTHEDLVGKSMPELTHPDDIEISAAAALQARSAPAQPISFEKRYLQPSGHTIWVQASVDVAPGPDGNPSHYIVAAHDITARKVAEAERERLQAQLLQAQKMDALGIMAGGVAHDFNNILAAILCSADMLLQDLRGIENSTEMQEIVFELQTAAQRGADIVKQILTFSRKASPRLTRVDVQAIARETLDMLRKRAPQNVTIRSELSDNAAVMGEATQIQQVITNLCTNAFHAMEPNGGLLQISIDRCNVNEALARQTNGLRIGEYVAIRIVDDGCGMDESTLRHIFEPFFTTKGGGKGTGLGMAVVHGIVSSHDGVIRAQSTKGKGTTIEVWLPAITATEESITASTSKTAAPQGSLEHILLVDDDVNLGKILRRLLQGIGYQVTSERDSAAAIELFEKNPDQFQVALVDLHMPAPDGIEVAKRLHTLRPKLPIFLMSGYSDALGDTPAEQLGVVGVLQKPIGRDKLAWHLRATLDQKNG